MKTCPLSYITLGHSLELSLFHCTQLWKLALIKFCTPNFADFAVSFVYLYVLMLSHASELQHRVIIVIQASYCVNSNVMTITGELFLFLQIKPKWFLSCHFISNAISHLQNDRFPQQVKICHELCC